MKFSIRNRLICLAGIALAGLLLTSAAGWQGIVSIGQALGDMANVHLPAIREAESMRAIVTQSRLLNLESLSHSQDYDVNDRFAAMAKQKAKSMVDLQRSMENFTTLPKSAAVAAAWEAFQAAELSWLGVEKKINLSVEKAATLDPDGELITHLVSLKTLIGKDQAVQQAVVEKALDALVDACSQSSLFAQQAADAKSRAARGITLISVAVVGLFLVLLCWYIVRSIVLPLEVMRASIVAVASSKDFTIRNGSAAMDEIGQTVRAFNDLLAEMQGSIRNVLDGAADISRMASSAAGASGRVAESSTMQNHAAAAMAAAIQEMTVSIDHVASSAQEAFMRARIAGDGAAESAIIIQHGAEGMRTIADTVHEASVSIDALGQQSLQINAVVVVIKDVADQTNLLALNAAIEAARAGESGRGFAVVADEVRNLAERTAKSTREIDHMVTSMQRAARLAIEHMKSVVSQVGEGGRLSEVASQRMLSIRETSQHVVTTMQTISGGLSEQNGAAREIAGQISQVVSMVDENAFAAQTTAEVARDLDQLAAALRAEMAQFKV